jgi:integrase
MKKHQVEARIDDQGDAGKLVFRRKRSRELKAVEEVLAGGLWRARTPKDKRYAGQVRFRIVGLYVAGRRVQRFFSTLTEAQTFIEAETVRQGNLGARAMHVSSHTVEDAVECEMMLKPHGLRLLDAVRDFIAARECLQAFPAVSLEEAARHYGALLEDRAKSWTVDEAAQTWLASRVSNEVSGCYLADAQHRLARFRASYGSTSMADISTAMVGAWVNGLGLGPQSRCNYLTVLSSMFSYAVKQERSPRNPVLNVERPNVVRDEPGILKPDELRALLRELPDDTVPYIVLSAFAGLRPMEVRRLNWSDINFKTGLITVKSATAKGGKKRRTVPMTENLRAWLRPLAQDEGLVVPLSDGTIRLKRIMPARERAKLNHWPHDCLRHSAASYWLQLEGDAPRVALWLGHTQEVLHEHYKGLLSDPAHAAQWFAILPDKERMSAKIISIKAA